MMSIENFRSCDMIGVRKTPCMTIGGCLKLILGMQEELFGIKRKRKKLMFRNSEKKLGGKKIFHFYRV